LGLSFGVPAGIVALCIVLSCFLGILNMHHIQKSGSIPKLLKYVSVLSIGGMIVGITVVGLAKDILSDFAVFTVVIAIIIIGLLIVYLLISYTKSSK
jgi:predicted Na+-dependent transporter